MSAVGLSAVERRYGATRALAGVDLDVGFGERVAILGGNGAGKTTLVRIVAGLSKPTSGTVSVLGGAPGDREVRSRVGVVGHEAMLYPHLTARENVRLWAAVYGVRHASPDGLLEGLGIDPADRRPVRGYSRGMRQRVSLARALVHSPDLLVLDEPFAGLDAAGAEAGATLLRESGATLLLATHQDQGTFGLATRTVVLERGVILADAAARSTGP